MRQRAASLPHDPVSPGTQRYRRKCGKSVPRRNHTMTIILPRNLTAREWRAKKGVMAKVAAEATGLGAALDRLQQVWNQVPWQTVDPARALADESNLTSANFTEHSTAAAQQVGHV